LNNVNQQNFSFEDILGVTGGGGGGGRYSGTAATVLKGNDGGGNGGYGLTRPEAGTDGLGGGGGGGRTSGAAGGSGVVIIRIKEVVDSTVEPPSKPEGAIEVDGVWKFEWDGVKKIAFPESEIAYDISGDNSASDAGAYEFTVILKDGFTWKGKTGDEAKESISCSWEITKASNYINNLSIKNWEVGALPNVPKCEKRYGVVKYSYKAKDAEDIEENYSTTPPTEEGEYILRAKIEGTSNYAGAEAKVGFSVFSGALDTHTDYVAITIAPKTTGESAVDNLPVRVILKENDPFGFSHEECIVNGINTLRFFDANTGDPLVYSNSYWKASGVSEFWVKVPRIDGETEILVYWGLRDGKTPVVNNEEATWEAFTYEEALSKQNYTVKYGLVSSAVDQKSHNKFKVLPSISKHEWYVGEEPATITKGELLDGGAITNYFVNRYTGEHFDSMPEVKGAYVAVFEPEESDKYYPIQVKIDFLISESSPINGIAGNKGDNGRILLMNADTLTTCPVADQGYNSVNIANSTWWDFDSSEDTFNPSSSTYK
jgi:hypothetical protein